MKYLGLFFSLFLGASCLAEPATLDGTETRYQIALDQEKLTVQINTVELGQVNSLPQGELEELSKNTQALADATEDQSIVLFRMEGDDDPLPPALTRNWKHLLIFEVPKKVVTLTAAYVKNTAKKIFRWPDQRSWALSIGYYLPIRVGVAWSIMLSKGVDPEAIHHYIVAEGIFSVLHYAGHHTYTNFYNLNTNNRNLAPDETNVRGMLWRWTKNFSYDVGIYNTVRWLARGQATPWTQTVLGDGFMGFFTNIMVNSKRDRLLREKKYLTTAYGFFLVPINCLIQTIAQIGHEPVLKSISIFHYHLYDIRPSTGVNLAIALLLYKVAMKNPERFVQKLDWVNDRIILPYKDFLIGTYEKALKSIKVPFKKSCAFLLGGKGSDEEGLDEYDSLVFEPSPNTFIKIS